MREHRPREEKPLHWVGSAKKDLLGFPEQVMDDVGFALGVVQYGGHPPSAKPWKGLGPGVLEIVENDGSGTYRAVYTVRFRKAVYVLHVGRASQDGPALPRIVSGLRERGYGFVTVEGL